MKNRIKQKLWVKVTGVAKNVSRNWIHGLGTFLFKVHTHFWIILRLLTAVLRTQFD